MSVIDAVFGLFITIIKIYGLNDIIFDPLVVLTYI